MAVSPALFRLTHSLSDDPVLSTFFLGGSCFYFPVIDTVVVVLVSVVFRSVYVLMPV